MDFTIIGIFILGIIIGIFLWQFYIIFWVHDLLDFLYDFQEYRENKKEFKEYMQSIEEKKVLLGGRLR